MRENALFHTCTCVSVYVFLRVNVFVKFLKWKWKLVHLLQTEFAVFFDCNFNHFERSPNRKSCFWWDISCLWISCFFAQICHFSLIMCSIYCVTTYVDICFDSGGLELFHRGYNYLFWYPLEILHQCLSIERLRK